MLCAFKEEGTLLSLPALIGTQACFGVKCVCVRESVDTCVGLRICVQCMCTEDFRCCVCKSGGRSNPPRNDEPAIVQYRTLQYSITQATDLDTHASSDTLTWPAVAAYTGTGKASRKGKRARTDKIRGWRERRRHRGGFISLGGSE